MLAGFLRLKDRVSRRACFPQEGRLAHLRRRIPEIFEFLWGTLRLTLEMEELWLATRTRSEAEVRVLQELALMPAELRRSLRISEIQAAYLRAKAQMPSIEVPSKLSLFRERASLLRISRLRQTRRDLARFWIAVRRQFRHGQIRKALRVDRIALNALQEIRLAAGFLAALMTGAATELSPTRTKLR
jgi:hypothetical protein